MTRRFRRRSTLPYEPSRVWDWHARPGALRRLLPPWERVRLIGRRGSVGVGDRAELEVGVGPIGVRWVAEHIESLPGKGFTDRMVRGPFARWVHRHRFESIGDGACRLSDEVEYGLPGGAVGDALAGWWVDRRLRRSFAYRHRVTSADLALHERYFGDRPRRFLVTGSTGLVGRSLVALLQSGGHEVRRLVRTRSGAADPAGVAEEASWDPDAGRLDPADVSGLDVVVHLAGAGIADGRWTPARKRLIRDSRVRGTGLLAEALARAAEPPRVLVCASAVGYYGDRGDAELDEGSAPGSGFLPEVARAWEEAAAPAADAGIRVVNLRIGVVLTPAGGALARMLPPFLAGVGGPLGDGRQYWSWIAIDDLLASILHVAATEPLTGPVNATAPAPVRNDEFTRVLGRVLRRPAILPVPAPALRLLLGQMGDELLLASTRAHPRELADSGFEFRYGELETALRHVLGRTAESGE